MIWLVLGSILLNIAVLVIVCLYGRAFIDEFLELKEAINRIPVTDFPPVPDCKFQPYEFRCNAKDQPCLYSPGSEPERICVLREEEKKSKDAKIPAVITAPQWIDRSPSGENER